METFPIIKVERSKNDYRLTFEKGYAFSLLNIKAKTMIWHSLASGRYVQLQAQGLKMRLRLSGPRILKGLVRPGISLGREDLHPRLPAYRRYELRKGLQEAAKAGDETMTKEDADYCIDKAIATGALDSAGGLAAEFSLWTAKDSGLLKSEIESGWRRLLDT